MHQVKGTNDILVVVSLNHFEFLGRKSLTRNQTQGSFNELCFRSGHLFENIFLIGIGVIIAKLPDLVTMSTANFGMINLKLEGVSPKKTPWPVD